MADTSEPTAITTQDVREIGTEKGALRYYDSGGPEPAPVLLFLHGSGPGVTGWRNFRGVLPAFAAHYRCLILEFPGFGVSYWLGLLAPAGTPRDIVAKLSAELARIVRLADVREKLVGMGVEPLGNTPEQVGQWIRDEISRYGPVVKAANIRAE